MEPVSWFSSFPPSVALATVQEELREAPDMLLARSLQPEVELEEVASCFLGRSVDWFDEETNPRHERWITKREYLSCLFEMCEGEGSTQSFHTCLFFKLVMRLNTDVKKQLARFDAKLPKIPSHAQDSFCTGAATSARRKMLELLADWRVYHSDLVESVADNAIITNRIKRFIATYKETKIALDSRLCCPSGHYVDWCQTAIRGPFDCNVQALEERIERMIDFRNRDSFFPLTDPLPWTPLPQKPVTQGDCLIPGKEFEQLVVQVDDDERDWCFIY
jgi:hypothetical protein